MRLFPILTLVLIYSQSLLALDKSHVFPERYRGVWDPNPEACGHRSSDARLVIDQDTVEYWESSGQITEILKDNVYELRVKLEMVGEGEEWVKLAVYKLSKSSSVITEYFDDYSSFSRVRCKKM